MNNRFGLLSKVSLLIFGAGLAIAPLDVVLEQDYNELRYGNRGGNKAANASEKIAITELLRQKERRLAELAASDPAHKTLSREIEELQSKLEGSQNTLQLRELMGQGLAVAFLGGFRALTADYLWIKMHAEWEEHNYQRMPPYLRAVTWLQPQCDTFWELGGWHLGYNLFAASPPGPVAEGWLKEGEKFYLEGIKNIPQKAVLYIALARLYESSYHFNDPCRGAQYWKLALDKKDCPPYAHRMVGYALRRCAKMNNDDNVMRETFDWWLPLWLRPHDDSMEMWSSIHRELNDVKALLNPPLSPEEEDSLAQREIAAGINGAERIFKRTAVSP